MVAECIQHTGTNGPIILPVNPSKRMDESNYFAEFGGETIDPENLRYPLTVGENYPVYGIMFYDGEIRYLISGDNGIPFFSQFNVPNQSASNPLRLDNSGISN